MRHKKVYKYMNENKINLMFANKSLARACVCTHIQICARMYVRACIYAYNKNLFGLRLVYLESEDGEQGDCNKIPIRSVSNRLFNEAFQITKIEDRKRHELHYFILGDKIWPNAFYNLCVKVFKMCAHCSFLKFAHER